MTGELPSVSRGDYHENGGALGGVEENGSSCAEKIEHLVYKIKLLDMALARADDMLRMILPRNMDGYLDYEAYQERLRVSRWQCERELRVLRRADRLSLGRRVIGLARREMGRFASARSSKGV